MTLRSYSAAADTWQQCSSVNLSFGLTGDQIIAPPLTIWGVLPEGDVFKVQVRSSPPPLPRSLH